MTSGQLQGGWEAPACAVCLTAEQLVYTALNAEALLARN